MHPARGQDRRQVVARLRQLAADARNLRGASPDVMVICDGYLRWVNEVETVLAPQLVGLALADLHTERHRRIREMTTGTRHPFELIGAEVELQSARLECISDEIEDAGRRFGPVGATGLPASIDEHTTVDVLLSPDGGRRTVLLSADAEILEACEYLDAMTGSPISLVTGDLSMRVQARARSIATITMPDDLVLPPAD